MNTPTTTTIPNSNNGSDNDNGEPPLTHTARYFTMTRTRFYYSRRLRSRVFDYAVTFHGLERAEHEIPQVFQEIIDVITGNNSTQHVRIVISSPALSYPISMPFSTASAVSAAALLSRIQNVMNSNESFVLDDGIKLNVFATANTTLAAGSQGLRSGGGIQKRTIIPLKNWGKTKRSIISIKVTDNNCFIASLEVAKVLVNNTDPGRRKFLCRQKCQNTLVQTALSEMSSRESKLVRLRGGGGGGGPFSIAAVKNLRHLYEGYELNVVDGENMGAFLTRENVDPTGMRKRLNLFYTNGHVDVITSMKALFNAKYFCFTCLTGHAAEKHLCSKSSCVLCLQPSCKNEGLEKSKSLKCPTCQFRLYTPECFTCHGAFCLLYTYCLLCKTTHRKKTAHKCGSTFCPRCKVWYATEGTAHRCFVQRVKGKQAQGPDDAADRNDADDAADRNDANDTAVDDSLDSFIDDDVERLDQEENDSMLAELRADLSSDRARRDEAMDTDAPVVVAKTAEQKMYAFDIETDQSTGEHLPVLLIYTSLHLNAAAAEASSDGVAENEEIYRYFGYDCIDRFCTDIFSKEKSKTDEIFIAHYGSGFDFLPILRWLYEKAHYKPSVILRGNKVITMTVGRKKFIDSYLFIQLPLASFPKAFNISELKKGYFPHLLTCPEILSRVGEPGWYY